MITKYINELTNFDPVAPRTVMNEERVKLLYEFLENKDQKKLFVWVGFEAPFELQFSYDLPPKYEGGTLI